MTLNALEHRDISQIDRVPKWFVCFVASLAFAICQRAEIDRMPALLDNVASLGMAPKVFQVFKQTLVDIVSSAALDDVAKDQVVAQLEHGASLIQLVPSAKS